MFFGLKVTLFEKFWKATPKPKETPKPTKEPTAVAFVDMDGDGVPDSAPTDATMVDDSVNDDGTAADESTMLRLKYCQI